MKWNCKKIVIAAILLPAGMFCTEAAAAEGLSSEEKIGIIDEIVKAKIKEAKGGDALDAALDAVAAKFPLDPDEKAPGYIAFIKKLEEQTRKKYPITDKELEKEYRASAEMEYPIYNIRDNVTVVFLLVGKPFTVTGTYYRQDSKFVWVGSKKIPKVNLEKEYVSRFDVNQAKQLRANYIWQKIRRYHQQKDSLLKMLKSQNKEKISELRGEIKFNGKWLSPRKVVMERYEAAFTRQENTIEAMVHKAKNSSGYNEKIKILESVIQEYPDHKSIAEFESLLEKFKEDRINDLIAGSIQKAKDASDYNVKFNILESIIKEYPDHQSIAEVKALLEKFKKDRINDLIAGSIQKAKDASDYNVKFNILESIIKEYPDHQSITEAKKLLQEFKTVYAQRTEELKKILAYCSQPGFSYKKLEDEYKIDLTNRDVFLYLFKVRFQGIPEADKLQNVLRDIQQKLFKASRDTVEQLAINAPGQKPQLVIRKQINAGNEESGLFILPIESMSTVKIFQMYVDSTISRTKRLDALLQLKNKYPNEGTVNAVNVWSKLCAETSEKLTGATNDLAAIRPVKVSDITSELFLSNLNGPVILCVWEKILFKGEVHSGNLIQSWYYEYIPSSDTQEWILK